MSSPTPQNRPVLAANRSTAQSHPNRIDANNGRSTPLLGVVYWAPARSLWFSLMYGGALLGGSATFRLDALALCLITSAIALCAGYSVGIHRRLIHNSFQCHPIVEAFLVYLGTLAGLGGPFSLTERHDIREWAQSSPRCHRYFISRRNPLVDWLQNIHCEIQLSYPPVIRYETRLTRNWFYQWLEQTWMLQQLPLAIAFYHYGGWSWVFWGIYVRISLCATLVWLAHYLPARFGQRPLYAKNAAVQLGNIPALGLLTMGESWQNHHQNIPHSARFGVRSHADPGWWFVQLLSSTGLAWNICNRKQLQTSPSQTVAKRRAPVRAASMPTELSQLAPLAKYRKS